MIGFNVYKLVSDRKHVVCPSCLQYLSQVDNVSNRADHAGSPAAKHLFDPLLFESTA